MLLQRAKANQTTGTTQAGAAAQTTRRAGTSVAGAMQRTQRQRRQSERRCSARECRRPANERTLDSLAHATTVCATGCNTASSLPAPACDELRRRCSRVDDGRRWRCLCCRGRIRPSPFCSLPRRASLLGFAGCVYSGSSARTVARGDVDADSHTRRVSRGVSADARI